MATQGHSLSFCGVLSETRRIIRAHYAHFLALSALFLLPISFSFVLYLYLINLYRHQSIFYHYHKTLFFVFNTAPAGPTIPQPENPNHLFSLLYYLFILLFSISGTASITHSTVNGFYGKPIKFIYSIKSIFLKFFPLLATALATQIILFFIFFVIGFLIALFYLGINLLGFKIEFGSSNFPVFMIFVAVLCMAVSIYLQIEWSLASVVVMVESQWGFAALKRSAYLIKGMKRIAISIMLYCGITIWVLELIYFYTVYGGISWSWGFIVQTGFYSIFIAQMMLQNVAAYTVLYMYCKALHGELALEIAGESAAKYFSLPSDDGKVPHVVYVVSQ